MNEDDETISIENASIAHVDIMNSQDVLFTLSSGEVFVINSQKLRAFVVRTGTEITSV